MYSTAHPRDYPACSGCSLCRLVCPMWRARRDPRFSGEGIAKARQGGARAADLGDVLDACVLCGACDPVCPEGIALTDMILGLRRELAPDLTPYVAPEAEPMPAGALLLPGAVLRADPVLLERVRALLGLHLATDDGADMLDGRTLVVGDGLLLRWLRASLPGARLQGLGEALGNIPALRRRIAAADFYVIEARAYHADHARLVGHYDGLRQETGCAMNLDLQRIAIPACDAAEASWMLKGRRPARIVVEDPAERELLRRIADVPVLHLAELNEESAHA